MYLILCDSLVQKVASDQFYAKFNLSRKEIYQEKKEGYQIV